MLCPLPASHIRPSHLLRRSELQQQAGAFVLRRTQDVLARHLPPLSTFTVFVKPSELQVRPLQINGTVWDGSAFSSGTAAFVCQA